MKINIDKILEHKGKTRYWLSKETNFTYPNLMNLCNNKTDSLKFEVLEQICIVLECTPNDILIFDVNTPNE